MNKSDFMGFQFFKFFIFALLAGPAFLGIMQDNKIEHAFLALVFIFWAAGIVYSKRFLLPMMFAIFGTVVAALGKAMYEAFKAGKQLPVVLFFVWLFWIWKSDNKSK